MIDDILNKSLREAAERRALAETAPKPDEGGVDGVLVDRNTGVVVTRVFGCSDPVSDDENVFIVGTVAEPGIPIDEVPPTLEERLAMLEERLS